MPRRKNRLWKLTCSELHDRDRLVDSGITKHPELLNPGGFSVKLRTMSAETVACRPSKSYLPCRIAPLPIGLRTIRARHFSYAEGCFAQGIDSIAGELIGVIPDKPKK